ncbi:MAG: RnfABCDGE type electron transport complex subunit D [Oscillospiraceae bacterium]|nr:RnfABCDGE type electron transport complex subunit D [Oscillospiraceae bacterium]
MKTKKPQIHEAYGAHRDILLAALSLLIISCYMYGLRPLFLVCTALLTAVISDFLAAKLRGLPYNSTENSSLCTAVILTLMMPATVSYYVVIVAVLMAVLVGKHLFGGYGAYPFNPAAVGYVVALVGWPAQLTQYPTPFTSIPLWDTAGVIYSTSPMATMKLDGLPNITPMNLALGNYAGGMGATAVLVVFSCFLLLLLRRRISFIAPVTFLFTCAAIAFCFPRVAGADRLDVVKYELLSSTLIYAAVFLLSDLSTLPKKRSSRIVFGLVLGALTMAFRYYGAYELGVCFALIVVNAVSGYLDRMTARAVGWWRTRSLQKNNPELQLKPPRPAAAEETAERPAEGAAPQEGGAQ